MLELHAAENVSKHYESLLLDSVLALALLVRIGVVFVARLDGASLQEAAQLAEWLGAAAADLVEVLAVVV